MDSPSIINLNRQQLCRCVLFPKRVLSTLPCFNVHNHHHPNSFCTRPSMLDFLGLFVCKVSLGLGADSTFNLLLPQDFFSLLSISFFSISSPSIRPSVTTPYVRLRSVGLDSTYVCRYVLFPSCFLFLASFLLLLASFLPSSHLSLSFCLLFSSASRLELIRLLGWLGWVGFTHHAS